MTALRVAPSIALLLLLTAPVCLATRPFEEQRSTGGGDAELVRTALAATGTPSPVELEDRHQAVLRSIDQIVRELGPGKPGYRRARRLHRLLHRRYLLQYEDGADGIHRILDEGAYNCLSATIFYGLIADRLGYRVKVIEYPGHLLLRIAAKGRAIDVETTEPRGFDLGRMGSRYSPARGPAGDLSGQDGAAAPLLHRSHGRGYREVSLEETLGFAWLNTAWRALEDADPVRAAESVREAKRYLPPTAGDDEELRGLLARAFRGEYESGRFDTAYRIASIDVELFPGMTTSRDRILAAAVKRIERDCAEDRPAEAERLIDEVESVCGDSIGLARLSRRAQPLVAAAAVRLGEWDLARHAAERYAAVEPDAIEAYRLLDWVDLRSSEPAAESVPGYCQVESAHDRGSAVSP